MTSSGDVGYLPQDPRTGDLHVLARNRILSARGLDEVLLRLRETEGAMASADDETRQRAMERYGRLEAEFTARGGYAAESEAASMASSLGLPERVLEQPLGTLSGGQRRRVELARILFSGAQTLLLDEPTNHLDADSILWLREHLKSYQGGLVVISHDVACFRSSSTGSSTWTRTGPSSTSTTSAGSAYLTQRETDERRRKRERANAEKKAATLMLAGRQDAGQGDQGSRCPEHGTTGGASARRARGQRVTDKVAKLRFPEPAPCGRTPLTACGLSSSYGSLEVFTDVDLAIDSGSRVVVLGLNGAGKTTLLRMLAGVDAAGHR